MDWKTLWRRDALFDWTAILTRQRLALLRLLVAVAASVGEAGDVPRSVRLAALAFLLRAEAATRRLIQTLAEDVVVTPRERSAPPSGPIPKGKGGARAPVFPLFDPRTKPGPSKKKRPPVGPGPQAGRIGIDPHVAARARTLPMPDDPVCAEAARRRIAALRGALEDLPAQARRLARALARGHRYQRVMRPGRPPGHRALPENSARREEIDDILADCHQTALWKMHLAWKTKKPPGEGAK